MKSEREQVIRDVRKRRKAHGHHGGAWKVAFADFMTSMMALFLVLWLIACSGAALFWPTLAPSSIDPWIAVGEDGLVRPRVSLGSIVAVTMFVIVCDLPVPGGPKITKLWPCLAVTMARSWLASASRTW